MGLVDRAPGTSERPLDTKGQGPTGESIPAKLAAHDVTRLEVGITRLGHLADGKGLHDRPERNRRLVGVARHPDALRGVDR